LFEFLISKLTTPFILKIYKYSEVQINFEKLLLIKQAIIKEVIFHINL